MRRSDHERGSALIFVLWIALFISLLAAAAAVATRGRIIEARVENSVMREEAALRSALEIAAWDVALQGRTALLALPRTLSVGDHQIEVSLASTHNRIDINMADETAWRRVFIAAGAPQQISDALTDQILDWRDGDSRRRPFGAEAPDYAGSGKVIGDRVFASIDELVQVRDMTDGRLACIFAYLTVFGGTGPQQGAPLDGLAAPTGTDGVRVAYAAQVIDPGGGPGRRLSGLAQYGAAAHRPYEWVRFGGDDGAAPVCDPSVF